MATNLLQGLASLTKKTTEIRPDLLLLEFTIVNACIVGRPQAPSGEWVLIDTALPNSASFIVEEAEARFGQGSRPQAIILTHGHFDHVGSVIELADRWNVPVYAHQLEMPYLTGQEDYPEADPTVDSGLVAKLSPSFPNQGINLAKRIKPLPADGSIPGMADWRWIHTPGHTPGQVCLFRDADQVLISADALITVEQESFTAVLTQKKDLSGPPAYFTTDWAAAEQSVQTLAELKPALVIPGHGQPMQGEELAGHLQKLVEYFDQLAVPEHGKFV